MATELGATVKISAVGTLSNTPLDVGNSSYNFNEVFSKIFTNGNTSGKANVVWTDKRTIAFGANDDIDFAGVLTDIYGASLAFTSIKTLIIKANDDNANALTLGGDTSANVSTIFGSDTDTITLPAGACICLLNPANGYAVTATTADKIRLTNPGGSGSIGYEIIAIGTKA